MGIIDLCRWWLRRVRRASKHSDPTASISDAPGSDVQAADATETLTIQNDGLQPFQESPTMANDVAAAASLKDLHEALQKHLRIVYGPLVTTDFMVIAECVNDEDQRILYPAISDGLTSWKMSGMARQGFSYFCNTTG